VTLLLCLALVAGTLSLRQIDQQIETHRDDLKRTRRRVEEIQELISGLGREESSTLARLEAWRERVSIARKYIGQLEIQLQVRTDEIAAANREVEATAVQIEACKADLGRRLVSMYKYGRLLPVRVALSADSVSSSLRRMLYLRWVARADSRSAIELTELKTQLATQRTRLVTARSQLEALHREKIKEEEQLETSQTAEAALLRRIRSRRDIQQKLGKEVNAALARLQDLLNSLNQQREEQIALTVNHHFITNQGRLPWPLRGKIIARFGSQVHPKYKTKTSNRGIDIETDLGQSALAIWDGTVVYADRFMGYGKMVILDHHGGFYTLYGNLEAISVAIDERVMTARAVGRTKDYLHFEIRKQGQPVDPLDWLQP
jgi:septal ring factor EnvC (AmiA/AmiB activator)